MELPRRAQKVTMVARNDSPIQLRCRQLEGNTGVHTAEMVR